MLKMLSLNKHRINERVGRSESIRDFKIISGRVSEVRKRASQSGLKEQMR